MLFSVSKKFIVWTDASSKEVYQSVMTTTGYVIKHGDLSPSNGSSVYYGINNSKGEITAGIESLVSVRKYCRRLGLKPSDCEVEMKTDFNELSNIINGKLNISRFPEDPKKQELKIMLKDIQNSFKNVCCEEIHRKTNIAHNVCCLRMRRETDNDSLNGLVEFQKFFYNNPDICVEKGNDNAAKEILKFLRSQHGAVAVSCTENS